MKKLTAFILSLSLILSCFIFTACGNDDTDGLKKIRLNEVARSVFYAPMYVAINNGYFEEEGIKIELSTGNGANNVMTAITSKSADIGLMGPEATVYCQVQGQIDYPIIFGQLTKRDGSFLVSKKNEKDTFKWTDLKDKHILAGRKGGVPAMTVQYVVNQAGLKTSDMNFNTSVDFALMGPTFTSQSSVDYTTLFEPTASQVVAEGKGYIVAAIGEASGEIPYTSFSASKSYIDKNPEVIKGFLRAIIKGYNYVTTNKAEDVAKSLQKTFTGVSLELLASSVVSYTNIDAWCKTPYFTEEAYIKLQTVMENAGELSKRVAYTKAVDNTYVNAVIAETA